VEVGARQAKTEPLLKGVVGATCQDAQARVHDFAASDGRANAGRSMTVAMGEVVV
jgi:hypothetical protein